MSPLQISPSTILKLEYQTWDYVDFKKIDSHAIGYFEASEFKDKPRVV